MGFVIRKYIAFVAMVMAMFLVVGTTQAVPLAQRTYGDPWGADFLSNLQLKASPGAIRFRAERNGTIDKLKLMMRGTDDVQHPSCPDAASCYGDGTGGTIRIEIRTDDGTANHFPSATVLSTFDIVDPRTNSIYTNTGDPTFAQTPSGQSFWPLLDMPNVSVTEGTIYHIVGTNIDSNTTANYVSFDSLGSSATPPLPPEDPDTAILTFSGSWSVRTSEIPNYEVWYTGGAVQGQLHVGAEVGSPVTLYDTNKIRERFTVSGGDKLALSVSVRVRKIGTPTVPLDVRLQTTGGSLIEAGTIPVSAITGTSIQSWATYTFTTPRQLSDSSSYDLILSSAGTVTNSYETHVLSSGVNVGGITSFQDGIAYETSDGTNWSLITGGTVNDMQMYFTTGLSLIGYWKFDDNTGTTAIDSSGGGNNGTLTGGPSWVDGIVGKAISFDGVNDYVNFGDVLDSVGTGLSIAAWVKPGAFTANAPIVDKLQTSGNYRFVVGDSGGLMQFGIRNTANTFQTLTASAALTLNNWTHVVATFDDSATGKIYLNGTLDSTKTNFSIARNDTANLLRVGWNQNNGVFFNGVIDEVQIYSQVLSASDVQAIYNQVFPTEFYNNPTPLIRMR